MGAINFCTLLNAAEWIDHYPADKYQGNQLCYLNNKGPQTKPKLLTFHNWLILECEVCIAFQISASDGIPPLIQLWLLLSSVNCRGYLLQAKENPDTDFLHSCFAPRTKEKWGLLTVWKKDNAKKIVGLLAHCWLECCIGMINFFRLSFHNYILICVFHCNDLCNYKILLLTRWQISMSKTCCCNL